ncbi:MAG: DNA-directed RNA polymerase subunit omega [Oscillospiraceae bacterium]
MMLKPAMSDMIKRNRDGYAFVVAIAKRARVIAENAEEQGMCLEEKPVQLAVTEFDQHPWDISSHIVIR